MPVTRSASSHIENPTTSHDQAGATTAVVEETSGSSGTSQTTCIATMGTDAANVATGATTAIKGIGVAEYQSNMPTSNKGSSERYKQALARESVARKKLEFASAALEVEQAMLRRIEAAAEEDDNRTAATNSDHASMVYDWVERSITDAPQVREPISKPSEPTSEKQTTTPIAIAATTATSAVTVPSAATDLPAFINALTEAIRGPPKYNVELPNFNGNCAEWMHFKSAYTNSESHFSRIENLERLRRSLRGEAKEAASFMLIAEVEPQKVIELLEAQFGRPEALLSIELQKIRSLPRMGGTEKDLFLFANRISSVVTAIKKLGKEEYMYNPEIVNNIVDKFHLVLKFRWYDFAKSKLEKAPELQKLAEFLQNEASQCSRYAPLDIKKELSSVQPLYPPRRLQKTHTQTHEQLTETKKVYQCAICTEEHEIRRCNKLKEATLEERLKMVRQYKLCFRCLRYRRHTHRCGYKPCGINSCKESHHSLLHATNDEEPREKVMSAQESLKTPRAYLKVLPVELTGPKGNIKTYALLDEGSTITLIDSDIAVTIGVQGPLYPFTIEGVAGASIEANKSAKVELQIQGVHHHIKHKITAHTIDQLNLSPQTVLSSTIADCRHLMDIQEQLVQRHATPHILIGQDNWHLIVTRAIKSGPRERPIASLTELGWVLHGVDHNRKQRVHFIHRAAVRNKEDEEINSIIKEHFELDNIGITPRKPQSDPEQRAIRTLEKTCKRLPDQRFEVGLLWRDDEHRMPHNRDMALKRLYNIEKRLDRDPVLRQAYEKQMQHLFDNGYAEPANEKPNGTIWYLPHFAVVNPSKSRPRIVHDAAARTRGVSLNDMLLPGPDLLQSLPGVLMRFRQLPIAVAADIKEMFLQIRIQSEDRDALRFLWRGRNRNTPPNEYRMTSVVFGAASSPCTALFIKNKNAQEHANMYPEATEAIIRNHYMDDYLQSFDNILDARRIANQVKTIHELCHFQLRGWTSNEPMLIKLIAKEEAYNSNTVQLDKDSEKLLGLRWRPSTDTLGFNVNFKEQERTPTKRETLRVAMSVFDPLGLITPINIQAKHILQETWRIGLGWDEILTPQLKAKWDNWVKEIKQLAKMELPRAHNNLARARSVQLHTFVDASKSAYAAASYWRVIGQDEKIHVSLVAAKGRVAPLKVVSIPRLELQAALLGARLAKHIIEEHDFAPEKRIYWSDSRTVLAWLQKGSRSYKPFVAHRLAEIEETTRVTEWRWVPTRDNAADDATREIPSNFNESHRWYRGPDFLYAAEDNWPKESQTNEVDTTNEERVTFAHNRTTPKYIEALPEAKRFSSWLRLIRSTGRVLQFIERCRKQTGVTERHKKNQANKPQKQLIACNLTPSYIPLEGEHIKGAEILWIKAHQQQSFHSEIQAISNGGEVSRDSRLKRLALVFEKDEIIKLQSRIAAAENVSNEQRTPTILDGNHHYVKLYIAWMHLQLHHSGVEAITNEIRQRFWVMRLRPSVRSVVRDCVLCRNRRALPPEPPTGNLPKARVAHHKRPFSYTGVDYFGPLSVTIGRRREKRYVALFTCLTTRAIHLEIAASLSTDSAIMALRRMMARRGCPTEIWSDNGTNLRGADAELRRAALEAAKEAAANYTIMWKFIPPGAPFMGGAWERLVRSVKTALHATLHERHPPEEVLQTVILEVEHTINSRPLTHVSVAPEDPAALTPNDFLLGSTSRVPTPGSFNEADTISRKQWRHAQQLANKFWARWVREALPLLQQRRKPHGKGPRLHVGDVVIIADGTLPRNTWPKAVIEAVYPGPDGVVRIVDVRTRCGILRRPAKRLILINAAERQQNV